jgi:hypothetical protein
VLSFLLDLQQPRSQDAQGLVLVLQLALLVLARHDEAGGLVRDPDRRVRRVDGLTTRARRAEDVDLEVVGIDLDIDLFGFRQDRDGRRARVDAALALGRGNSLHSVRTAFVLEPTPRVLALGDEGDVAEPAVFGRLLRQHLELHAAALGVPLVHAEEVAGPEVRLFPAFGALDLDDDVATFVGVARQQQVTDLGCEGVGARFLLGDLRLQVVAHVGLGLGTQHLARVGRVLLGGAPRPVRIHERLQLGEPPARIARRPAITRRVDPRQIRFQPLELNLEVVELLEHAPEGSYWRERPDDSLAVDERLDPARPEGRLLGERVEHAVEVVVAEPIRHRSGHRRERVVLGRQRRVVLGGLARHHLVDDRCEALFLVARDLLVALGELGQHFLPEELQRFHDVLVLVLAGLVTEDHLVDAALLVAFEVVADLVGRADGAP